jgi:hypothetical protein
MEDRVAWSFFVGDDKTKLVLGKRQVKVTVAKAASLSLIANGQCYG